MVRRLGIVLLALLCACSKSSNSPTAPGGGGGGGNHNPTVNINTDATHLSEGGTANITVTASDPDGGQVTFAYAAVGGTVSASGPTATSAVFSAGSQWGPCSVTVTASDGKGGSAHATASMYIRNPNPPAFVVEPVGTSTCGYGTPVPDGFAVRITSPESVVITDIAFGSRDCGTCGVDRNYVAHPIALGAAQQYVWLDGGCWTHACCTNQGCTNCNYWSVIIAGTRPEPDGGSFYYTCPSWDQLHATSGCY
jgi:hypothetical protein